MRIYCISRIITSKRCEYVLPLELLPRSIYKSLGWLHSLCTVNGLFTCLFTQFILSTAHPGAVTLLLKYGARVDIANADGSTSLHVAVANGVPLEIVHSLVKVGTALGKKDNKGFNDQL